MSLVSRKALLLGFALLLLSSSLLADGGPDKKKKKPVPDGGTTVAYTLVSGAAILGSVWVVRRQRAAKQLPA